MDACAPQTLIAQAQCILSIAPRLSSDKKRNRTLSHSIGSSKFPLCNSSLGVKASNFYDLLNGQFVEWIFLVAIAAMFFGHVLHVLPVCSGKQMVGTNAPRIVTPMKNFVAFWNRSKMQHPRNSVGVLVASAVSATPNYPVTFIISSSRPNPTVFLLLNLGPEPGLDGDGKALLSKTVENSFSHIVSLAVRFCFQQTGPLPFIQPQPGRM